MRQFVNAFPSHILSHYQPEIKLILDYLFFRHTIMNAKSAVTPGNILQNLRFKGMSFN